MDDDLPVLFGIGQSGRSASSSLFLRLHLESNALYFMEMWSFRTVSGNTSEETGSPLLSIKLVLEVQLVSFRAGRMAR